MIDRHTDRHRERERDRRMEIEHTETARSNLIHVSMKKHHNATEDSHLPSPAWRQTSADFLTALNSAFFSIRMYPMYMTSTHPVYDTHMRARLSTCRGGRLPEELHT